MDVKEVRELKKMIEKKPESKWAMSILEIQKRIIPDIKELLKKEPESISSVEKTNDGWVVHCDVLEKKSVPETFDLLKVFEFKLDNKGKITGFKQIKKIRRGDLS